MSKTPWRFTAALTKFGTPLEGLKPEDFIEKGLFYRMGYPPLVVDILPEISCVNFDAAWGKRGEVKIGKDLKVFLIDADSLIASKLAAGRPEGLADVAVLQRAASRATESKNRFPKAGTAKRKTPKS